MPPHNLSKSKFAYKIRLPALVFFLILADSLASEFQNSETSMILGRFSTIEGATNARHGLDGICPAPLLIKKMVINDDTLFWLMTTPEKDTSLVDDCFTSITKMIPGATRYQSTYPLLDTQTAAFHPSFIAGKASNKHGVSTGEQTEVTIAKEQLSLKGKENQVIPRIDRNVSIGEEQKNLVHQDQEDRTEEELAVSTNKDREALTANEHFTRESSALPGDVKKPEVPVSSTIPSKTTTAVNLKPKKKKSTFVPPGFENLLEPQTTEVDVYFGGLFLLSTFATYTPTDITFLAPDAVVGKIPGLLDPEVAIETLTSPLPTHSELACLKKNQSNCGQLTTDSLEIIFDENRFRVDIFIGSLLLAVRGTDIDKFLPPSSAGASLLHQINAAFTGVDGNNNIYNITNSTTLSYKETRIFALSNITTDEDFTVDTLALEREFSGRLYQAGFFRTSNANLLFINETDFAGISIGSSLDTRNDLDQSAGNELQIFLESRSRVGIFKDGRLISTRIYDAGNQILDTSQLPGGAYDVELVIRNSFGQIREETRFYVKTNDIPPLGQTLYFFDFGELVLKEAGKTLPSTTGESVLRAGISKRLWQDFGAQLGVMKQEDASVIEAGIFKLGRVYDLNFHLASGNKDDFGLGINARVRAGRTTLNANLRQTWIDSDTSLMGKETLQVNLSFSFPLGGGLLNLTGRYNEQIDRTDRNIGVRYNFPIYTFGSSLVDVDIQVTRDNGDLLVLFGARLSRIQDRWRNEISSQYFYENPEDLKKDSGFINDLATTWNDGDKYISDVTWNMRAIDQQNDRNLDTNFEVISDKGRLNLDASYSVETDQLNYGANFATTFIANKNTISFGGRSQARSALVMAIEGDVEDAYFDVQVNGAVRGSAKIGEKTVIGIQPYDTYEVVLIPRGDSLVDFTDQTQTATLYPGNVVTMTFKATRVLVAFGQIVDENGNPVTNALIRGVIGLATTDEFGLFQAEIDSTVVELDVRTRTSQCKVQLPDFDSSDLVITLQELVCRASTGAISTQ